MNTNFYLTNTADCVSTPADNIEITGTPRTADLSTVANNDNIVDRGQYLRSTLPPRKRIQAQDLLSFHNKIQVEEKVDQGVVRYDLVRSPGVLPNSMSILDKGRSFYMPLAHRYGLIFKRNKSKKNKHARLEPVLRSFFETAISTGFPMSIKHFKKAAILQRENCLKDRSIQDTDSLQTFRPSTRWAKRFAEKNLLNTNFMECRDIPELDNEEMVTAGLDVTEALSKYKWNCIFTVEKAPLFFEMFPKDVIAAKLQTNSKDQQTLPIQCERQPYGRITLLVATNAADFKIPIAIVGNQPRPTCLNYFPDDVHYIYQQFGLITEEVIKTWFEMVFVPAVKKHTEEKVALYVDTSWIPLDLTDGNTQVDLVGIPSCDTSSLQPLKRGIISSIQMKFRLLFLDVLVRAVTGESDLNRIGFHRKYADRLILEGLAPDLSDVANYLGYAWKTIPKKFIASCWMDTMILPSDHETKLSQIYCRYKVPLTRMDSILVASCGNFQMNLVRNISSLNLVKLIAENDARLETDSKHRLVKSKIMGISEENLSDWIQFEQTEPCKALLSLELESILNNFFTQRKGDHPNQTAIGNNELSSLRTNVLNARQSENEADEVLKEDYT